jgi:hypothetical protein
MVLFAKEAQSHNDRIVASTQEEIRRLARNGNGSQPEAASSISSGLSIVGKIIGHGALTIFGRVEGEVRASNVVIAEGAQIVGDVVAEELTVGGHLKGTIRANRVKVNSTAVARSNQLKADPRKQCGARPGSRACWPRAAIANMTVGGRGCAGARQSADADE